MAQKKKNALFDNHIRENERVQLYTRKSRNKIKFGGQQVKNLMSYSNKGKQNIGENTFFHKIQ